MISRFFGLVFLAAALLPAQPAQAQWAVACTRDPWSSVNLRRGPSQGQPIVASIPNGDYLRPLGWVWGPDGRRWYRVESGGLVGYSRHDYVCF
jgi:uncharacterized protein YraI